MIGNVYDKHKLITFLKHPFVQQALITNNINKLFQLFSYTDLTADFLASVLADIGIHLESVPDYSYGIAPKDFIKMAEELKMYLPQKMDVTVKHYETYQNWVCLHFFIDSEDYYDYSNLDDLPQLKEISKILDTFLKVEKKEFKEFDYELGTSLHSTWYAADHTKQYEVEVDIYFWNKTFGSLSGLRF